MLGEQIGDLNGQTISKRVVEGENGLEIEVSGAAEGTLLGVPGHTLGTYRMSTRPDGTLAGGGHGVFMGAGGERATFRGIGMGIPKPDGSVAFRGTLIFTTDSEMLLRLNRCAVAFEQESAADGTFTKSMTEWR